MTMSKIFSEDKTNKKSASIIKYVAAVDNLAPALGRRDINN